MFTHFNIALKLVLSKIYDWHKKCNDNIVKMSAENIIFIIFVLINLFIRPQKRKYGLHFGCNCQSIIN